jgi:hypothetical protein
MMLALLELNRLNEDDSLAYKEAECSSLSVDILGEAEFDPS